MKRLFCALLALCLLCCAAFQGVAESQEEEWTLFESRFGFTLWYPADQLDLWIDDWLEETAECFCPWEDESGVAELVCRGSRYSAMMWDDYTRISDDELDADFGLPFEVTAYTDGETIAEQWIVSAPDADYVFIIEYEVGDPQGWAPLFHSVLETLEFPGQSAGNADAEPAGGLRRRFRGACHPGLRRIEFRRVEQALQEEDLQRSFFPAGQIS